MDSPRAPAAERILVVDDNEKNRRVAEGLLVSAGYEVLLAAGGREGLARFQERPPDLALLDVMMPDLGGIELCARLRALPEGTDTPIVFLTAATELDVHRAAIESGADDFLTKPIGRTELLLRVRSLLRIRRLGRELRASHDTIRAQRDALVRAQERREELMALVVHDLKNPLAGIVANVQVVVGDLPPGDPNREALTDTLTCSRTLHRMIMNLLDISRSEDGELVPRLEAVELDALTAGVLAEMAPCAAARQHEVALVVRAARTRVRADPELVRRVLQNLLDNSFKHTPPRGKVRLELLDGGEGWVELRVHDEGPGVPSELRERIFEKYVQLDRGFDPQLRARGGLGLRFCKLAVGAHGGEIWVEEGLPRGACFCVRLPTVAPPARGPRS